jgi:hypothetical protein
MNLKYTGMTKGQIGKTVKELSEKELELLLRESASDEFPDLWEEE